MDIRKMLEEQRELDKAWLEKGGIAKYPLQDIKTAYRVELGELLNEWQGFKFWKTNKVIDKNKMIEEWADCMHFALSLEGYDMDYEFEEINCDWNKSFLKGVHSINSLKTTSVVINRCFSRLDMSLALTIALGLKLGFVLEEMEQAYYSKNKKNWDRVRGDY